MAHDDIIVQCNQRKNAVAVRPQRVHQIRFGLLPEGGGYDVADCCVIVGCFRADRYRHEMDGAGFLPPRSCYFLLSEKAPGPAAAMKRNTKQNRIADSPPFRTGKKFLGWCAMK